MTTPQQPLPGGGPSREAAALMEIAHTTVSRAVVRFLVTFFVGAIAVVPVLELAIARASGRGLAVAVSRLTDARREMRESDATATADGSGWWRRIVSGNRILLNGLSAFERALEDESLIARSLRPSAQLIMTGLGAGNERVYPGRDRWLFYRPDVEYLTGRAFLDPAQMRRRIRNAPEWTTPPQPNPLTAIIHFRNDLRKAGVVLIVMPTPHKPAVHPDRLTSRYGAAIPVLQNPSFAGFVEQLEQEGVLVFKPLDVLTAAGRRDPQYLATDTHWRPEAMETVAERLAAFIAERVTLPDAGDPRYRLQRVEARNIGDTARMLDLPEGAQLFPSETVWLRRVLQPDGSPWRSSRTADVLVLGDSFSNIYALESMGWGTSAGFVEQLSYALRRPVDRLVQNDEGAFATRAMLERSPERLEGKRVVVYQFAERELAFGDWKLTGLQAAREHGRGSR